MEKVCTPVRIDNGYFVREADPDRNAALLAAHPGENMIHEEPDAAVRRRMDAYTGIMKEAVYAASRPQAYDRTQHLAFCGLFETLFVLNNWGLAVPKQVIPEELMPMAEELAALGRGMNPMKDPEAGLWYIWDASMPHEAMRETADFRYCFDGPAFRPFLIPYLAADQERVKGNLIIVSGGAYEWRSNRWEGYEAVPRFLKMGYNCFLLQRRVRPYQPIDGALDLQRSIRYLRTHASEYGIGAIDRIAVNGYSGGAWCIMDMLTECRSLSSPDIHDGSYVPDETDRCPAAVDAVMLVYGARFTDESYKERFLENPDLPPVFLAAAQDDFIDLDIGSTDVYRALHRRVPAELHIYAGVQHGFGVGICEDRRDPAHPKPVTLDNASRWPDDADLFLKSAFVYNNKEP